METLYCYLNTPVLPFVVSTLPIRNGNPHTRPTTDSVPYCKYLTYKEWKLCKICDSHIISNRKYLTYKEWKLRGSCDTLGRERSVSTLPIKNENQPVF